jgi:hypothetical protein
VQDAATSAGFMPVAAVLAACDPGLLADPNRSFSIPTALVAGVPAMHHQLHRSATEFGGVNSPATNAIARNSKHIRSLERF